MSKNPFAADGNSLSADNQIESFKAEVLSPEEETKLAIENGTATEKMIAEMRQKLNNRNKGLALIIDENKAESSKRLSEALLELDAGLINSEIIDRVKENIKTPKDFADYAKAIEVIYCRLQKQMLNSADKDDTLNKVKESVRLMFGNGVMALGDDNAK